MGILDLNLIGHLDEQQKRQGVIAATRGNHGQSVALASSIFGVRCLIAIPEGNNPEKNEAMEAYGAELLIHGKDFDEAREKVESLQREQPMRYVHSGNEPLLIHGVGTYETISYDPPENGGIQICAICEICG